MLTEQFINAATNIGADTEFQRSRLVMLFETIDKNVKCEHSPAEAYYQADYILRKQHIQGPIVEFGCYAGGMSCKLSHVAEIVDKKLILFDSFQGLPKDAIYQPYEKNLAFLGQFKKNQFSCSLVQAQINLQKYGMFFLCEFVEGIIEETLPAKNINPAHVFIDVDIIETAKFIIENIYNKTNCKTIFTHEACLVDYVDAITDDGWWEETIKKPKPVRGSQVQGNLFGLLNGGCLDCLTVPEEDQDYIQILRDVKL